MKVLDRKDETQIIESTISILDVFGFKNGNDIYLTMVTATAELLLDNKLKSLKYFSNKELSKLNSLDGVQKLEKLLLTKINENKDEFRYTFDKIIEILKKKYQ